MDKKAKEGIKKRLGKYWIYLLLVLALFFLISLSRNVFRILEVRRKIDEAQGRVDKLRDENEALRKRLTETQSEAFMEAQLRDKLGLSKEGETIVVLPDPDTLKKIAPAMPEEEETLPDPNWKRWLKLFF
jgi:cell division protein FtsB